MGNSLAESEIKPAIPSEIAGALFSATPDFEPPTLEHEGNAVTRNSCSDSSTPSRTATLSEDARGIIEQLKTNMEQTNQRVVGIQDTLRNSLKDSLKDVTWLMIKLHNHSARVGIFPFV